MPRDEYDDRDDDRPRRRRDEDNDDRPRRRRDRDNDDRDRPAPKSNTGLILLIVGLVIGLPMLACGGFGVWAFIQGKKVVDQVMTAAGGEMAAMSFLNALEAGNTQSAYDMTSANFKAGMPKDKFEALVKANPVLTSANHNSQTGIPTPTGTEPTRRMVLTFTVNPGAAPVGMEDEDDEDNPFKPKVPKPKGAKENPNAKGIVCTITLAEQPDKQWKVDGFTIP